MRKSIFLFISFNIPRFVVRHIAWLRSLRWCDSTRPVTRNEEFSEIAQIFSVSNSFKLPPTHCTRRGEKILGQPPILPPKLRAWTALRCPFTEESKTWKVIPIFTLGTKHKLKGQETTLEGVRTALWKAVNCVWLHFKKMWGIQSFGFAPC